MGAKMQHKRAPMTVSMDRETSDRLRRYANQRHSTISQCIIDWIWREPVKDEPAPDNAVIPDQHGLNLEAAGQEQPGNEGGKQ